MGIIEPNDTQVRKVVKNISNTFWFTRQVMKNAPNMVIVSPDSVRQILKEKLIALSENYNLSIF